MKLSCRNCGYELIDQKVAIKAVQEEWNYTENKRKRSPRFPLGRVQPGGLINRIQI